MVSYYFSNVKSNKDFMIRLLEMLKKNWVIYFDKDWDWNIQEYIKYEDDSITINNESL